MAYYKLLGYPVKGLQGLLEFFRWSYLDHGFVASKDTFMFSKESQC